MMIYVALLCWILVGALAGLAFVFMVKAPFPLSLVSILVALIVPLMVWVAFDLTKTQD